MNAAQPAVRRVALASFLSALSACSQKPDPQLEMLQAENQRLQKQLATQGEQMSQLIGQNKQLGDQLAAIQGQLTDMRAAPPAPVSPPAPATASDSVVADQSEALALPEPGAQSVLVPTGETSEKLLPGWVVEAYPMKLDPERSNWLMPPEQTSLGSFVMSPGTVKLLDHRKSLMGNNYVQYRGAGYYAAKSSGTHSFLMSLEQTATRNVRDFGCDVQLTLESSPVIQERIVLGQSQSFSAVGGAELGEGLYAAEFRLTCNWFDYPFSGNREIAERSLSGIMLTIGARAPGQAQPVTLSDQDLVYISKK